MIARFTILALALLVAGEADTLRLRNGKTVTGSFLGGSAGELRFMVEDQVQRFPLADVVAVDFTGNSDESAVARVAPIAPPAPPPVTQPNVIGVPFMRGANGLISLEMETAMLVRGNSGGYGGIGGMGGGMGGGMVVYRIQGAQSPVRVRRGDKIVFVVRLNSGNDPRRFEMYMLQSTMNYRQSQPLRGGGRPPALPVTITQTGDYVYEISPARTLFPGEYSLSPIDSNQSFCFGVDY